ncbi:MAG: glycoside hydrolase family 57 [Paenibacillaceae bacterium]|nr:glycoside hydrolase family 57 [Paenibacillaceae bacterium]
MSTKPGIIFMPHGNLQYSQLEPKKRAWVIKESYEKIFDAAKRQEARIAFEASGETVELMAKECPEVLKKLVDGIREGRIEPVGSPHTHIMLANIDPEIGLDSLRNGLDTWEKYTGFRPVSGWNPECSWASYIPNIFREAGFEILIADADSYLLSAVPGLREATGLQFDVRGHSNKNALFKIEEAISENPEALLTLFRPNLLDNGLKVILRSDMLCNLMLWYLMGATEGNREQPIQASEVREALQRWQSRIPGGNGFIMPYAEDAEYVGTTAYFYVKQFGLARFFEPAPESVERFHDILAMSRELGYEFITPVEAAARFEAVPGRGFQRIENGCAWHGGTAKAWNNTVYSRILDPVCISMHQGLKAIAAHVGLADMRADAAFREIMRNITTAYVSDARWPPAPTSPGRFNVQEALSALELANANILRLMEERGIEHARGLYSPGIMATQIAAITDELMGMEYFEERSKQ